MRSLKKERGEKGGNKKGKVKSIGRERDRERDRAKERERERESIFTCGLGKERNERKKICRGRKQ